MSELGALGIRLYDWSLQDFGFGVKIMGSEALPGIKTWWTLGARRAS
jgi:hypothetical protein